MAGAGVTLVARADPKLGPVDPREMAGAEESRCERNLEHRQGRLAQQLARMIEPDREKVALQSGSELV